MKEGKLSFVSFVKDRVLCARNLSTTRDDAREIIRFVLQVQNRRKKKILPETYYFLLNK